MGPLDGVKVVEVANYMSGPFAGMMLADLGAEVIKVEPPGGDPFRSFARPASVVSPVWAMVNRGTRSTVLDLKVGAAPLLELVREADIFISNWRPGVAERLGVSDEVLAGENAGLIRCWITGAGPSGPRAADPAFDTVAQALSGMTEAVSVTGEPTLLPGYFVDKLVALVATQSILAALVARARSGQGDRLDIAMLDVAAYVNYPELLCNRAFLDFAPPEARNVAAAAQKPFPASDGWFVLATVSGGQIRRACDAVGHPEWASSLLLAPDQASLISAMGERFTPVTRTRTLAYWLEQLRRHDVPAAPCLRIDEHLADPQVAHNEVYALEEWPVVGQVRVVRHPTVSATFGRLRAGAPTLVLDPELPR